MGIEFLKNENIFHLSGGDVSYILKIYKNAFPMHLYWGKRLSDPAISWYLEAPYRRKKLLEGTEPDDPMFLHEFWPYEYPEYGISDYRPAALEVVGQDGCCISELRYEGGAHACSGSILGFAISGTDAYGETVRSAVTIPSIPAPQLKPKPSTPSRCKVIRQASGCPPDSSIPS